MSGVEFGECDPLDHQLRSASAYIRERENLSRIVSDELYCGGSLSSVDVDKITPPSTNDGAVKNHKHDK
ncbi:MAG: hypothetical protein M3Q70_02225 [bacterium]|nr:hypothetical protein [bacterium]